jgi:hypothetical protein
MPTVLRQGGFRFVIYPADHRPAHVHAVGHGGEAVFDLKCPKGPPELREVYGLSRSAAAAARWIVTEHLKPLCRGWEAIHGAAH